MNEQAQEIEKLQKEITEKQELLRVLKSKSEGDRKEVILVKLTELGFKSTGNVATPYVLPIPGTKRYEFWFWLENFCDDGMACWGIADNDKDENYNEWEFANFEEALHDFLSEKDKFVMRTITAKMFPVTRLVYLDNLEADYNEVFERMCFDDLEFAIEVEIK